MLQQIIQISNLTPDQFTEVVRGAVRSELAIHGITKPVEEKLPEFLTRKETATLLRISLVTLHKLSREGILQSKKIQGQVRYRRDDVLAAMKEVKNDKTQR